MNVTVLPVMSPAFRWQSDHIYPCAVERDFMLSRTLHFFFFASSVFLCMCYIFFKRKFDRTAFLMSGSVDGNRRTAWYHIKQRWTYLNSLYILTVHQPVTTKNIAFSHVTFQLFKLGIPIHVLIVLLTSNVLAHRLEMVAHMKATCFNKWESYNNKKQRFHQC